MEQAAAASAPVAAAAAPDAVISTLAAPVIATAQAIGWAAPVLNFGSVLPLQSSTFFPNLAPGNVTHHHRCVHSFSCVLTQLQVRPHRQSVLILRRQCLATMLLFHHRLQPPPHLLLKTRISQTSALPLRPSVLSSSLSLTFPFSPSLAERAVKCPPTSQRSMSRQRTTKNP
jgi:hypothetical protein